MSNKKPAGRKPRARYPNIQPVQRKGVWKWRARARTASGKRVVGPARDKQEEAAADVLELRKEQVRSAARVGGPMSWSAALAKCREELIRKKGSETPYVVSLFGRQAPEEWGGHAGFLLKSIDEHSPIANLSVTDIETIIAEALTGGRNPNTLIQRDLPLVDWTLEAAGLERIVRKAGNFPKTRKPAGVEAFTLAEAAELVAAVRAQVNDFPSAAHHADLIEFMARTGVRTGEFSRITRADVELEHGRIFIRKPKDRSNPRIIEITEGMRMLVARMLRHAEEANEPTLTTERTLGNMFKRWQERLGEPRLNGRVLRHTCITGALEEGASLPAAMQLAGHTQVATTNRYLHAALERKTSAAKTWDDAWRNTG